MLYRIDRKRRLYVLRHGDGYSCLGFEVAERKRRAVLQWLGAEPEPMRLGTKKHFAAYEAAMRRGRQHNAATGLRCMADLEPALRGLEGKRVEVVAPDGERNRFYVGRSTGWFPCHLEIKTRRSTGGVAAFVPEGATVRVVGVR